MSDIASALPKADQKPQGGHLILYVVGFVGVQVFFLLLTLFVACTPWFLTHDAYPGMRLAGYSLRLKHEDCDIVIYGDSSALTGLDPDIIQGITGLKTCNLSEGISIEAVVGSLFPLDNYLKNNKRPLFLLTMYTSGAVRPYIGKFDKYYPDGLIYALQYDRNRALYWDLLKRPDWLEQFDLWAGRRIVTDFLNRYLPGRGEKTPTFSISASIDPMAQRESRHGIWPFPLPPETQCVRTAFHYDPGIFKRYASSVEEMRRIYAVDGTTVLVNIAPVPTCDTLQQVYRERNEGLHDNAFESLPISYFNEGDVHFSPEGSKYISIKAGNQILALEARRHAQKPLTDGTAERPE